MNRIRKIGNMYQVLITPDIKVSPDSSLLIGNWEDESLRNYYVLQFPSLNEAMCEAYKLPDINWYRIILNHEYIYKNLESMIKAVINNQAYNIEFKSTLMDPEMLKNTIFERVVRGGERFNLRYGLNDIITFTIINPWSNNLHNISKALENYRSHLHRDDLRLRAKKIIDGNIIILNGITEFGTIYEIKLIPTLLYQWGEWYKKAGFRNQQNAENVYQKYVKLQYTIDNNPIVK
jgi:hypothetical protein